MAKAKQDDKEKAVELPEDNVPQDIPNAELPAAPEVLPPAELITLNDFCNRIGTEGINKFAQTFIEAKLLQWKMNDEPKTYEEWEALYLRAKGE